MTNDGIASLSLFIK